MFEIELPEVPQLVETGNLPNLANVEAEMEKAYERYRELDTGQVADYIPALACTDPSLFGISICTSSGVDLSIGDSAELFSIQSISKAFVFALVCNEIGHSLVHEIVGVNNTGLPFNSVMAMELNEGSPMNPMVNAGAIATTAMIPGTENSEKWKFIKDGLSNFSGRPLEIDQDIYESETKTNQRNQALAKLLESYGRLKSDPAEIVDIYTKQCSLLVSAHDLSVMGATLANGGINPITQQRVVSQDVCSDTLTVLASCGMYEHSGEWLFAVGAPAKSGVSGGIVTIVPGKGALGCFSAPLDRAGNSVRGQRVSAYLSRTLGLNLFASS